MILPLDVEQTASGKVGRKASAKTSEQSGQEKTTWARDLLAMFVRNQLRVSLALPFRGIAVLH